jgi:hypothetical protein
MQYYVSFQDLAEVRLEEGEKENNIELGLGNIVCRRLVVLLRIATNGRLWC